MASIVVSNPPRSGHFALDSDQFERKVSNLSVSPTLSFCSATFHGQVEFVNANTASPEGRQTTVGQGASCIVSKTIMNGKIDGKVQPMLVAVKRKGNISLEAWITAAWRDIRIMSHKPLYKSSILYTLGHFWEEVLEDWKLAASPCIIMPLATNGMTLRDLFESDYFEAKTVTEVSMNLFVFCRDIANGIYALHQCGVVHGDLKLENILFFGQDRYWPRVRVSDFSHSIIMDDYSSSGFDRQGKRLQARNIPRYTGTRPFLIPEVRRQDDLDSEAIEGQLPKNLVEDYYACDIFSLGNLICTILNRGRTLNDRIALTLEEPGLSKYETSSATSLVIDALFEQPNGILSEAVESVERSLGTEGPFVEYIIESLILCLRDNPEERAKANEIAAKFSKLNLWIITNEGLRFFEAPEAPKRTYITTKPVPLYVISQDLSFTLPPRTTDIIRSRILHEATSSTKTSSVELQATMRIIGFAFKADPTSSADFLRYIPSTGAYLDFQPDSLFIRDWICYQLIPKYEPDNSGAAVVLAIIGHDQGLKKDYRKGSRLTGYAERVKGVKLRCGKYGYKLLFKYEVGFSGDRPSDDERQSPRRVYRAKATTSKDAYKFFFDTTHGAEWYRKEIPRRATFSESSSASSFHEREQRPEHAITEREGRRKRSLSAGQNRNTFKRPPTRKATDLQSLVKDDFNSVKQRILTLLHEEKMRTIDTRTAEVDLPTNSLEEAFNSILAWKATQDYQFVPVALRPEPESLLRMAVWFVENDYSFLAQARNLQCVLAVLKFEKNIDINAVDGQNQESTVAFAVRRGMALPARVLLKRGADPNIKDEDGVTALHWLPLLQDDEMDDILRLLLQNGAEINTQTTSEIELPEHALCLHKGCTPLHIAVAMRSSMAVQLLLGAGADTTLTVSIAYGRAFYDMTAFHLAIAYHFPEILSLMLDKILDTPQTVPYRLHSYTPELVNNTSGEVSIINLINVSPSVLTPYGIYSRIVTNGTEDQNAVESTLQLLLKRFPEKRVLDRISMQLLSVDDPYIWKTLLKLGIRSSLRQVIVDSEFWDIEPKESDERDALFWLACARDASRFRLGALEPVAVLEGLEGFEARLIQQNVEFTFRKTVEDGLYGMLLVLLCDEELEISDEILVKTFWQAAGYGDIKCMKAVWKVKVEQSKNIDSLKSQFINYSENSMTALHQAAKANSIDSIDYLLQNGWNIDEDLGAGTAVFVATNRPAQKEAMIHLIRAGASPYCCVSRGEGFSILHSTVEPADRVLRSNGKFDTGLSRSLVASCPEELLGKERILESRDCDGLTALQLAIRMGDLDTFVLLLELGVNVDRRDDEPNSRSAIEELLVQIILTRWEYDEGIQDLLEVSEKTDADSALSDRAEELVWLSNRYREMTRLLTDYIISHEVSSPQEDEILGDYIFLLEEAFNFFFQSIPKLKSPDSDETLFKRVFQNFNFLSDKEMPKASVQVANDLNKASIQVCFEGEIPSKVAKAVQQYVPEFEESKSGTVNCIYEFSSKGSYVESAFLWSILQPASSTARLISNLRDI